MGWDRPHLCQILTDVLDVIDVETVIVGQGIAGTTLSWMLHQMGKPIAIIDRNEAVTSSKIAAGIMTPITGMRFVQSSSWNSRWEAARQFYQNLESSYFADNSPFFQQLPAIRLFRNREERTFFRETREEKYKDSICNIDPPLNSEMFFEDEGGFEMIETGRLDCPRYLEQSRTYFEHASNCHLFQDELRPELDLLASADHFDIPRLRLRTDRIVFCQGVHGISNRWFRGVPSKPAKGEILLIRIPGCDEKRVIHNDLWLVPVGDEKFMAGSTFQWNQLDTVPTSAGQEELVGRLQNVIKAPFEIVDHTAAVRPANHDQQPVVKFSKAHPNMAMINGLGAKGALLAPTCVREYVRRAYRAGMEYFE